VYFHSLSSSFSRAEMLISPLLVKMAGQLFQILAILILVSQTPASVLVLGCFVFLFGVLEGGVSFWRAPLRL